MQFLCLFNIFVVATFLFDVCQPQTQYEVIIEHDLGNGDFITRGTIFLSSLRGEKPIISQKSLTEGEAEVLQRASLENKFYRLRVKSKIDAKDGNDDYVLTSVHAKTLVNSELIDSITMTTDGMGNVIAIETSPRYYKDNKGLLLSKEFDSSIVVNTIETAPGPDVAGFLQKLEMDKINKEKAEKQPKSFLGQYWMYIVPVVLLVMMSNSAQQQG